MTIDASLHAQIRLAWFSPLPPSTSGIAAYSAELVPVLRERGYEVDTFTEDNARDAVWKQRRNHYDLTVFQMGNASCHDYMWAYLFRYPGLLVLHDAQLHQARALWLTRRWQPRRDDYLAEFRANHPEAPPDAGELIAAGLGAGLYHHWPLARLVIESARLTVVHNARLRDDLREQYPTAAIDAIEMGVADPLERGALAPPSGAVIGGTEPPQRAQTARWGPGEVPPSATRRAGAGAAVRARAGIPADAIVVAAFGGITPEKRIAQLFSAVSAIANRHPQLHVMLVGAEAEHFDVQALAERWHIADRVHLTGFVPDAELADYMKEADICACLRWPTNRETSASWLRCLAAGRTTIVTELAHLVDVPTVDPRGWRPLRTSADAGDPVAVSIDLLDEGHSLQLALERLAADAPLRARLGRAARAWWEAHHQLGAMADAYEGAIARATAAPVPRAWLPPHLRADGSRRARVLAQTMDVRDLVAEALSIPDPDDASR